MTPEESFRLLSSKFPFEGYFPSEAKDAYRTIPATVLAYLKPGAKILDFGCGPCDKTAILQFLGYQCSGYDDLQDDWYNRPGNKEKILSFARECGIDFKLAQRGPLPFEKESFDMVMLHDVLEHLHDSPRDLLNSLLECAKPEGLLFITVPSAVNIRKRIAVLRGKTNLPPFEGYYWYPGSWRGHVREYVRDDLVKLAEYLGLDVLELHTCDHMVEHLPKSVRPLYLLVTRIFREWKDSWLLVARKRQGWTKKSSLPSDELYRVLGKASYQG